MTVQELVQQVAAHKLDSRAYIVFGSAPLMRAGIRESSDIDLFVTTQLYHTLHTAGWTEVEKHSGIHALQHGDVEAFDNWDFGDYHPNVADLLTRTSVVDGIPFASLADVRAWKTALGREKDIRDIALIDAYLENTRGR